MTDLLGGQVSMGFQTALSAIPHLQSGKLVVIGVAATKRLGQLPNVPTLIESGVPDMEVSSWNGLAAPAKTPADVVSRLHQLTVKALAAPDFRDMLLAQGAEPVGSTPEEFRAYVAAEIEKWARVIRASGMPIE
jgi:tripartite-type tricarboxylate transporter receptor subunit TctC